jgi:hypothetical protein
MLMDLVQNHELMANQAAALVVVMVSYVVTRLRRSRPKPDPLLYHLRSDVEQHRKQTLQAIYNSTDTECLSMLRMTRAPFYALCNLFRNRGLVPEKAGCTVEEQVAMFLHLLDTTKGLVWFTNPLGGQPRLSIGTSTRFSMLLVSLEVK